MIITKEYEKEISQIHDEILSSCNWDLEDVTNRARANYIGATKSENFLIKDNFLDKISRLANIGASNTIEEDRKTEYELFAFYKFYFPQYKFISKDALKNVCKKYGLIIANLQRFKGFIPESNLHAVENFLKTKHNFAQNQDSGASPSISQFGFDSGLEIAAPKDKIKFNSWDKVEDFELVEGIDPKDPIILQGLEGSKYFLCITAWGAEAYDEHIINPNLN